MYTACEIPNCDVDVGLVETRGHDRNGGRETVTESVGPCDHMELICGLR